MEVQRRTQEQRRAATRAALVEAARREFGRRGYGAVSTEEIVRAAGVTRGALYHQFAEKSDLFAAVFEAVEIDLSARIAERMGDVDISAGAGGLRAGVAAWFDACRDDEVQRIVLLDGPSVLGWTRWREIGLTHGSGLVQAALELAMEAGVIDRQPLTPLTHTLIGALDEAALYISRADDPEQAQTEMLDVFDRLLAGLAPS